MRSLPRLLLASSLLFPSAAHAAPVQVSSTEALIAAIQGAKAGDEIILADGAYAISQNISCSADGTAEAPIVVRAATPLGAALSFDAVEGFKVLGKHWRFEGLSIRGVCASDSDCEHAFHVIGDADHFQMVGCQVRDFNAQLKANAAPDGNGVWRAPDQGLVEGCDLGDDQPRQTSNPVTKLNIDTGDDWVVRGNFIHDFRKDGGNEISYGAAPKDGGIWREVLLREVEGRLDLARVHFAGRVPYPDFCRLMQASRVHAYLTYPFVLGWSLIEAMSMGAAVIGSRTPPVEEVIEDGVNGRLVDFFDVPGWSAALAGALADPEALAPLRLAARRTVEERYALKDCLPRILDLVERTA
ncbi:MAG: glycosyltransferase, partial [Polyangiaceae bacterium]|nr:glycosyltransferase [Polyangiaceae bacterium]